MDLSDMKSAVIRTFMAAHKNGVNAVIDAFHEMQHATSDIAKKIDIFDPLIVSVEVVIKNHTIDQIIPVNVLVTRFGTIEWIFDSTNDNMCWLVRLMEERSSGWYKENDDTKPTVVWRPGLIDALGKEMGIPPGLYVTLEQLMFPKK